jgi:hypothetical protein
MNAFQTDVLEEFIDRGLIGYARPANWDDGVMDEYDLLISYDFVETFSKVMAPAVAPWSLIDWWRKQDPALIEQAAKIIKKHQAYCTWVFVFDYEHFNQFAYREEREALYEMPHEVRLALLGQAWLDDWWEYD